MSEAMPTCGKSKRRRGRGGGEGRGGAKTSEYQQSDNKTEQLHAAAQHTCEQQGVGGGPEDVAVHQLPPALLLLLLILQICAGLAREVVLQDTNEDGGEESCEEDGCDDGVHDAEPVDLQPLRALQFDVPAARW